MISLTLASLVAWAACGSAASGPKRSTSKSFISTSDLSYKLSSFTPPSEGSYYGSESTWNLTIDDTASGYKQKIVGFGAAVTDATVTVFNSLPADSLDTLLSHLMTTEGVNFGLMRHTIASSDLSGDPAYTYDDAEASNDDALSSFRLGERGDAMAAMLARMKSLNQNMTLLGSPWAPPAWMQLDRQLVGTTDRNNLDHDFVDQFAQYFVKYLEAFSAKEATVDAITIQNEPLNSQSGYPTMYVYANESGALIRDHVGPALQTASLNTQIWAYDHNTDVPSYPQAVLDLAGEHVSGVAWHCYAPNNDWGVLTDFHNTNPATHQYMSECWTSPSTPWHAASSFTVGPLQNWAEGAMAWTLGSDTTYGPHLSSGGCDTCRGLVTVDTAAGTYDFQVDYYMMGQYSRFMPKGATVLAGTGSYSYDGGAGIQSVATLNPDGSRTVVVENTFGNDVYVTLDTQSGQRWNGQVLANSVTTWII